MPYKAMQVPLVSSLGLSQTLIDSHFCSTESLLCKSLTVVGTLTCPHSPLTWSPMPAWSERLMLIGSFHRPKLLLTLKLHKPDHNDL